MSNLPVPFNRPAVTGKEIAYVSEAIASGHLSGDGQFTRRSSQLLEAITGSRKALLTTSCTHALEMAAILLEIKPGDEVIVPSFTFVSTVNAFVLRGALPVFCDIKSDTLNLDPALLPTLVTAKTRAIFVVHYAGVACEMNAINAFATAHALHVVEDNAHGLFGTYQGRPLGSFGSLATQSFHETKNITCGEGGALLINDEHLVDRAEIIREKGTNRSRFFRGQVDKYSWVDIGSSYLPSELLAAYLTAQLECQAAIQARRMQIWQTYDRELVDWAVEVGAKLPFIPQDCEHPAHMFQIILPSLSVRQACIAHLKANGVLAVFHYLPLHLSAMGRQFGGSTGDCPNTERISDCLLRLPLFYNMTDDQQNRVIDALRSFADML